MSILYSYDKSKFAEGEGFPGVPTRSLTQEEFASLPKYLQQAVDSHPAYRKQGAAPEKSAAPQKKAQPATAVAAAQAKQDAPIVAQPPAEGKE